MVKNITFFIFHTKLKGASIFFLDIITFSDQYDSVNRKVGEIENSYSEATTSGSLLQCNNCAGNSSAEIIANERRRAAEFSKKMNEFEKNMKQFGKRMSNMGNTMQLEIERTMREAFGRYK